jgi:hypothetical protein
MIYTVIQVLKNISAICGSDGSDVCGHNLDPLVSLKTHALSSVKAPHALASLGRSMINILISSVDLSEMYLTRDIY